MDKITFGTPIVNINFGYLNPHIQGRLAHAGIRTVGDLVGNTRSEIMTIPFFGKKSLRVVEDFLSDNGLGFGMEDARKVLVLPDNKDIDWEQRRYEIAKEILPTIYEIAFEANDYMPPRELIAEDAIKYADALIDVLKKGQRND